jgi:hypothetical protein
MKITGSLYEDLRTSINNVIMVAMVIKVTTDYPVIMVTMVTNIHWLLRMRERTRSVSLCRHFLTLFCLYSVTMSQTGSDQYKVERMKPRPIFFVSEKP